MDRIDLTFSSCNQNLFVTTRRGKSVNTFSILHAREKNLATYKIVINPASEFVGHTELVTLEAVDFKVGFIWGDSIWDAALSRALVVDGADLLIYCADLYNTPMEDEFWWVRTYENVTPSFKIRKLANTWQITDAGTDGVVKETIELMPGSSGEFQIDLVQVQMDRKDRPYLADRSVPM